MKNLKIGLRLAIGYGAVLLLMVVILFLAATRLASQNQNADTTVNTIYPIVVAATTASYNAVDTARLIRNLILRNDPERIAANKESLEKARLANSEVLARLEQQSAGTEKGRELMQVIKTARIAFNSYSDEVIALAVQSKDEEATTALFGEKYTSQATYLEALKNMVDYQEKAMQDAAQQTSVMYHSALLLLLGLGGAAILIGLVFAFLITRSITQPIKRAVTIAEAVAAGDLTTRIEIDAKDETGQLMQALKNMNDNLIRIVSQVRTGTDAIATGSAQIATGNQDLSSRTEQQASSLEETAASMEELTSTVKQNADNARQANVLAVSASDIALKGGAVVAQVVTTMGSINDSAKKIVDIIAVIDGIAFQTNILALNAAVEAARAGEEGRGFAVVASEVRSLAQRSAAAAKEIKSLIGDSVEKVDAGSLLVTEAGSTMDEIVSSVKRVTDIMSQIVAASQEQSAGIEQVNEAISQMDQVTQQNAALVEQAAAAAESLQDQARHLSQNVAVFKLGQGAAKRSTLVAPVKKFLASRPPLPMPVRARLAAPAGGADWEEF